MVANYNPPAPCTRSSNTSSGSFQLISRFTMRKKKLGSPSSAVRKDMLGGRGTSWGRLGQLREAGWGNGGGRARSWLKLLAKKKERSLGLARRPAPKREPARRDDPGGLDSRASLGPSNPGDPSIRFVAASPLPYPAARPPASRPHGGRTAPHIALPSLRRSAVSRKPGVPGIRSPRGLAALAPEPPPSAPAGSHLRGAPVAELVGDGLDAPGPGHRDVAALRAHVQPHHRHGRLSVRLRFGSVCVLQPPLPAPAARGSRGVRSCHADGHTDDLPVWHRRIPGNSGGSQRSNHGRKLRSASASRSAVRAVCLDIHRLAHQLAA